SRGTTRRCSATTAPTRPASAQRSVSHRLPRCACRCGSLSEGKESMKRYNDGHVRNRRGALGRGLTVSAAVLFATAGCEVVNPGPVSDEFLTLPASQQGFVNGSKQRLVEVVGNEA